MVECQKCADQEVANTKNWINHAISSDLWFVSKYLSFPSIICIDKQVGSHKVSSFFPKHGSSAQQNCYKCLKMHKGMR